MSDAEFLAAINEMRGETAAMRMEICDRLGSIEANVAALRAELATFARLVSGQPEISAANRARLFQRTE